MIRNLSGRLTSDISRDLIAGGVAGLLGGVIFWWALDNQGMTSSVPGLLGVDTSGLKVSLHLLLAIVIGAGFGGVSRNFNMSIAATISVGGLYGLVWWIIGPLTLGALFDGRNPTWSLLEANDLFPSLIGHLLFGGTTGLGSYILLAAYRQMRPEALATAVPTEAPKRRVVILGGGFGGVSVAQRLEKFYARDASLEITLVSQSNYLLFTPMLAEVASSALEAQHISAPLRASCPHTRFRRAEVIAIDTEASTVLVNGSAAGHSEEIPYDHLVLALGSVPNFFGLPGLEENSITMKTLEDATHLRNHVIGLLEHADAEQDEEERRRQLTFTVAGGGFAGTETIAELRDLVRSIARFYPSISAEDLRFVLIHSRDRILPELSAGLGDYALRKLKARGIEFLLNSRVVGANARGVMLDGQDLLPTCTLVWTAGNQPNPVIANLPCEKNRAGAVVVDSNLQVAGLPNVWALGDCAQVPDPDNEGQFYPPTAQHALREGKVVAENVVAALQGNPLKEFRFKALGILVGLGHRTGAAEIRGWRFSGLLAWFMWRSIYLSKLPGLEKKVRVFLDWSIDLFFPRDTVLTSSAESLKLINQSQISDGRDEAIRDSESQTETEKAE